MISGRDRDKMLEHAKEQDALQERIMALVFCDEIVSQVQAIRNRLYGEPRHPVTAHRDFLPDDTTEKLELS